MEKFRQILRQYWGYPDFRGIQPDIIGSVAAGHDTLGLMPTGGGKSITFQVSALAKPGLCLVVTPLIALMKDQVENLLQRGIRAAAIHTGMTQKEILQKLDNAVYGAYKFLYVSPERLATPLFLTKVRHMEVCLLTVDEAHCISQWGYDFRPEYLRIAEVRHLLPDVPVLALTATATPQVVEDIQQKLEFKDGRVFKMSFSRPNLHYIVRHTGDKTTELVHILKSVAEPAIVYTRSRRRARDVAQLLEAEGISALYYHAGLTPLDKDIRQQSWQEDRVRVMVATNAFGMGIDKPDVRLVIHRDVPDSIEAYFQEAGRAGRDGQTAYAVLLSDDSDILRLTRRIPQTFPDRSYIRRVYSDLASFFQIAEGEAQGRTFTFDIDRFCRVFRHFSVPLVSALELLTRAGYIHFEMEDQNSSRVIFLVRRDELYSLDFLNAAEEQLLNAMMREHGGLFTDYVRIEENRLGELCGLTARQVYEHLRHLTQLRVINYIPHKGTPQITYTARRVDTAYVEIPKSIYDDRRSQYEARIRAMIGYFTETDECRSHYLLRYFADDAPDCGCCDICLDRKEPQHHGTQDDPVDAACRLILTALSDGKPHPFNGLLPCELPHSVRDEAFRRLLAEEAIQPDGLSVRLVPCGG